MIIKRIIYASIFFSNILFADIKVINKSTSKDFLIKTLKGEKIIYVSTRDLVSALSSRLYENLERKKLVLYVSGKRIKISAGTSFLIIDDVPYQMVDIVQEYKGDFYLPAESFFEILRKTTIPGLFFDSRKEVLDIDIVRYSVKSLKIEQKTNGTIVRINTQKSFSDRDISSFINKHGWFYLTIVGGVVDTSTLNKTITRGIIHRVESDQINETAQIALKLRSEVISHEWYQNHDPNEIVITLRTALDSNKKRIKKAKDRWRLDTIVLDAGHGGKDPGTSGKYGTKEKDVVLDITKRVGRLLEKNTGIKVVYTRTEDIFIPLWKRTKIANEAGGKLFVSIHINSNPNRKIKGFETYLYSSAYSDEAIEVASRENSVIEFEEKKVNYEELSMERKITATMASSMFLKESEVLAAIIQEELDKKLTIPNRGVKQAGFYVLSGASMPCVLIEGGFVSNPTEEKNLKSPSYRKKIADGIYNAIIKFKSSRDKLLSEE
ncbi:MAG: hypothetical protein CMG55_03140 [Candidatus Marinimicrobia bacterium]|nr:hypothetical protein [Candidatus Neomarinimicrobiota bacterium]